MIRITGFSKRSNKMTDDSENYWAHTENTSRYLMKILVEFIEFCEKEVFVPAH
jgi:hypothetical protein